MFLQNQLHIVIITCLQFRDMVENICYQNMFFSCFGMFFAVSDNSLYGILYKDFLVAKLINDLGHRATVHAWLPHLSKFIT